MKQRLLGIMFIIVVSLVPVQADDKARSKQMFLYAISYHAEGDLTAARRHYEYALELNPKDSSLYGSLSYLYLELGLVDLGIKTLSKAITLFPNQLDFLYHRAYFYLQKEQEELALSDWNELIRRNGRHIEARWQRGHYYLSRNDFESALEDFHALDRHDRDPSKISTFFLAQTLSELGEYQLAASKLKEYAKALEQHESRWHTKGKAYFYIARNLRLAGKHNEAMHYYGLSIEERLWPDVSLDERVEAQRYSNRYLGVKQVP